MASKLIRKLPMDKIARRMTRSDSLSSVSEFGKIVPLEQQPAERKKRKGSGNPFESIGRALRGEK